MTRKMTRKMKKKTKKMKNISHHQKNTIYSSKGKPTPSTPKTLQNQTILMKVLIKNRIMKR
jgi:hypothetical protein